MKQTQFVTILMITLFLSNFIGCIEEPQTNTENHPSITTDYPLTTVALLETDFVGFDQLNYQYYDTPYTLYNLTGNQITWTIKEGFFSTYACNTSRVSESIIRFNSTEKATTNMELSKPFFMTQDIIEQSMEPIGNRSYLLKGSMIIKNNDTDFYILCFSVYDVFITIQGYGSSLPDVIDYAKTIESRIYSTLDS